MISMNCNGSAATLVYGQHFIATEYQLHSHCTVARTTESCTLLTGCWMYSFSHTVLPLLQRGSLNQILHVGSYAHSLGQLSVPLRSTILITSLHNAAHVKGIIFENKTALLPCMYDTDE